MSDISRLKGAIKHNPAALKALDAALHPLDKAQKTALADAKALATAEDKVLTEVGKGDRPSAMELKEVADLQTKVSGELDGLSDKKYHGINHRKDFMTASATNDRYAAYMQGYAGGVGDATAITAQADALQSQINDISKLLGDLGSGK